MCITTAFVFRCRCKSSVQVHNFHVVLNAKKQACRKVTKVWKKVIIAHYIHHIKLIKLAHLLRYEHIILPVLVLVTVL